MKSARSTSSLAIAAGGLFAFVVLISGVWLPKFPAGGLTQVGRTASVTFEDGTVMNLTESETDQGILKRRRMRGWNGHEYRQLFVMADGEEIDLADYRPVAATNGDDLSTGDHLMLAANMMDASEEPAPGEKRGSAMVADLQIDGKDRVVEREIDGKDSVVADLIDGKDRVFIDYKDVPKQPVFALATNLPAFTDDRLDMILLGGGSAGGTDLGDLHSGSGLGVTGPANGGTVTVPPIGAAVPEPSALLWLGVAGALGLAFKAWRRLAVAA